MTQLLFVMLVHGAVQANRHYWAPALKDSALGVGGWGAKNQQEETPAPEHATTRRKHATATRPRLHSLQRVNTVHTNSSTPYYTYTVHGRLSSSSLTRTSNPHASDYQIFQGHVHVGTAHERHNAYL